ncbi:MAG: hypothetical protein V3W18_11660 [candidate division Zixibacteria bacterium]
MKGSRFCIIGARLDEDNGEIEALPAERQKSGRLSSIGGINGFIILEGGTRVIARGSRVKVEWI